MNNFNVSGVITKDFELKPYKNRDGNYLKFTLGNRENNKDTYFNIIAFDDLATTVSENYKAGDSVSCECKIQDNSYEKDGKRVYQYSFILKNISYNQKIHK